MGALYDPNHTQSSVDGRIGMIAARQHGVFTRAQAMTCHATKAMIKWRLRAGRWELIHPRVYRLAGAPETWRQRAIAACFHLGPSAVLSHRAAAVLAGLFDFKPAKMEVTVRDNRNRSGSHRIKTHIQRDPIPEEDVTTIDGIRVTKPARTLLDLAASEEEHVVELCLDEALRRRLVSLPFMERWLKDARRKAHRGARVLQRLVDARAIVGVTESPLESQVLSLLRDAGLPIPMLQYTVEEGGRFVARLDFAYPGQRVAIEADGFRYHDRRQGFDDERARGNELEVMGWRVLRVTSNHLRQDPDGVIAWVRRALDPRNRSPS